MIGAEITILEKVEIGFGALGKVIDTMAPIGQPEGMVSVYDRRNKVAISDQFFDTDEQANEAYGKALRTSLNREWRIAYRGPRLNDPRYS